jgi:two-component system, cell cycle sensor histidine kinase and response regulator CckA
MTVLVVDDEPNDVEAMRIPLEKAGFRILSAESYDGALKIHQQQPDGIDMAILDISLPGQNGVDLFQELLKRKTDLKVLFVSGHVGAEIIRFYGLRTTDRHFLKKPFQVADLLARVHEIIDSPEQVRLEDFTGKPRENRTANQV